MSSDRNQKAFGFENSKLNQDRTLSLAIIAAVVFVLWWISWLGIPSPSRTR